MSMFEFSLPDIKESDLESGKERRKILEYLYQLTEQLRFTLSNLDEENLSDDLSKTITGAYTAASSVSKELKDMNGNVSSLRQFANSLTLSVQNKSASSVIALMANGIQIASQEIVMEGLVTFTSLSTKGQTTINGSNITTGTISADLIDVDDLYVKHLNAADGTFTGSLTAASGTFDELDAVGGLIHLGRNYIEINGVEIGYVPGYSEVCIIGPGYEEGNIGSGNIPWSQCVAHNLYSSSGSVNSYSMRKLKKCIEPFSLPEGYFDRLEPVYYVMIRDKEQRRQIGFIADDVQDICPELVSVFKDDSMKEGILTLDYGKMTALLVDEIKKLRARVKYLEDISA